VFYDPATCLKRLRKTTNILVRFMVIKAIIVRSAFWYITPCNPLNICRRIAGECRFHIQSSENTLSLVRGVSKSSDIGTGYLQIKSKMHYM
jgi:hypothetical protein